MNEESTPHRMEDFESNESLLLIKPDEEDIEFSATKHSKYSELIVACINFIYM